MYYDAIMTGPLHFKGASIRHIGRGVVCAALNFATVIAQSPTNTLAPNTPTASPSTWLVLLWVALMVATLFVLARTIRRSRARQVQAAEPQAAWAVIVACGLAIIGLLALAVFNVSAR